MLFLLVQTLNRDHGYPLRVIVPGVIGARSVKWLDSINIIEKECQVKNILFLGSPATTPSFTKLYWCSAGILYAKGL